MATAAITFSIPDAGVATAFASGGAPVAPSSTSAGTYLLAGRVRLTSGTYRLRVWAKSVATVFISTEAAASRKLVAAPAAGQPVEADFFVPDSDARIDLMLVNLVGGVQPYAVFTLTQQGRLIYASSATGWVWSTGATIADSEIPALPDVRLSMPVWTVRPNWANGITERLAWLTEVMTSEADVEQRRSLRRFPRRSIEASFLRAGVARQRAETYAAGLGHARKFLVPLWFDQHKITATVSASQRNVVFQTGTLSQREFWPGELVMLSNATQHEVVAIDSATGDTITLSAPAGVWGVGSHITPLRVARLDELPSFSEATATVGEASIRFDLDEPERNITPDWGYCSPLWRFKIDRSKPIDVQHERLVFTFDNETGRTEVVDAGGKARLVVKADLALFGRTRLTAFRQFIAQARGRSQRFWFPSGTHDVEPIGTISGTTMDVRHIGYTQMFTAPQDARLMLAFVFADGRPTVYRKIINAQDMTSFERLTLDVPLPSIDRSAIDRVSFVLPVRFDQDIFELHHVTDQAKAVRASVVVRTSEIDGLPPIDCWVTSAPYPVQARDDLTTSAIVEGGRDMAATIESVDLSATVTGGTMAVVLRNTSADTDSIDVSATILGGSFPLIVTYGAVDLGSEAIDVAATITGGTLDRRLITTDMEIESINLSALITGGSLA